VPVIGFSIAKFSFRSSKKNYEAKPDRPVLKIKPAMNPPLNI
jgi:hypothetical protein